MKLEIDLTDPSELRLAVEFMGKIAQHRDQEGCFHAVAAAQMKKESKKEPVTEQEIKVAVQEAEAQVVAEEAIEKASKPKKQKPVEVVPEAPAEEIDPAALQAIASAKSKTAGVSAVKDVIAQFGVTAIRLLDKEKLPELKLALEAL
jgi:hypothetical protein